MSEPHVFDRYTKAQADERTAETEVERLVAKVADIASRLRQWKTAGFTGSPFSGEVLFTQGGAYFININEMPSLDSIYVAVKKWRDCRDATQGAKGDMTEDQLRTLGLSREQ